MEHLLKHNSKVDHQTKTGCTPLMEATRQVLNFVSYLCLKCWDECYFNKQNKLLFVGKKALENELQLRN